MSYPTYTKQDVATFTGRALASFPSYVDTSALPQATLLFKIGTCLASLDDLTADELELAKNGILSMADSIHLAQPYAVAVASPFNSESIGSYSYSKVAAAVSRHEETGVMWFDLAIDRLSVCDDLASGMFGGGIEVFEHDAKFTGGVGGNSRMLSPKDIDQSRFFGFDPAPRYGVR